MLLGRQKKERNTDPINRLGRWLSWAAEDIDDRRRIEGALYVCVDAIRHVAGQIQEQFSAFKNHLQRRDS
jgi:hypothetical protein